MGKPPMNREQADRYLTVRAASRGDELGTWQGYAIEFQGRVVGEVGLFLQLSGREADLGFALHPKAQGQGLATEAARALIDHAIDDLGLERITAHTDAANLRSSRVLERLGMVPIQGEKGLAYVLSRPARKPNAL